MQSPQFGERVNRHGRSESWLATTPSAPWPQTDAWDEALVRLRGLMARWIQVALPRNRSRPWGGGHDEGTFASTWASDYLLSGDPDVFGYLKQLRDEYLDWAAEHQFHGYWPEQEVHHGPENHLYFQVRLWAMDPADGKTADVLEDLAHHLGNWVHGVPSWYDWEQHLLLGSYLGTRVVNANPPHDVNVVDCLRLVTVALATFRATSSARYLEWASDYADRWVSAILEPDRPLPAGLHAALAPSEIDANYLELRAKSFGAAPSGLEAELARVEGYVSAGGVDVMLDLWRLTGQERFLEAAERLLDPLVDTLDDGYAQASGMLLAKYRRWTGRTRYDERILARIGPPESDVVDEVYMDAYPDWQPYELVGIGRRRDMPCWTHKLATGWLTHAVGPSPAALLLAFTITGETAYVHRALDLAAVRLEIALSAFPDGREHGCASQSISSIVRGNGRENAYGNVTSTLYPAALGAYDFTGASDPEVQFRQDVDGVWRPGLPAEVATLLRPMADGTMRLDIVNRSEKPTRISVEPLRRPDASSEPISLDPGESRRDILPSRADLSA